MDFAFCVFTWGYGARSLFGVYGVGVFYVTLFYGAEMMRGGEITLVASLSHNLSMFIGAIAIGMEKKVKENQEQLLVGKLLRMQLQAAREAERGHENDTLAHQNEQATAVHFLRMALGYESTPPVLLEYSTAPARAWHRFSIVTKKITARQFLLLKKTQRQQFMMQALL